MLPCNPFVPTPFNAEQRVTMPVADHVVSFRNGAQIMVKGLQRGEQLGYCRNARVQVTDPRLTHRFCVESPDSV